MKGILLISHGFYAKEFQESLKMIAGEVSNLHNVCLESTDGPESFTKKLEEIKPTLDTYEHVLIFADLLGGSPCNTALQYFLTDQKYNFIAGMNFPMVLTALLSDNDVPTLIQQGKEGIVDVREFMKSRMSDDDEE